MLRRYCRNTGVVGLLVCCALALAGCPSEDDGHSYAIHISGNANPGGSTTGSGFHASFHWDF